MNKILKHFHPLFYPRSVAVVGASNSSNKWGGWVMSNLVNSKFKGKIYPVNRNGGRIQGQRALISVKELPLSPDLGLIIVPPQSVIPALKDLIEKGVGSVLIITAGFSETGEEGTAMEAEIELLSRQADIPVIGPNCQGLMSVKANLFAQAMDERPAYGGLSIISQSGNVGGTLVRIGVSHGIGFNKFVSSGNEARTKVEDLIEYFGEDETTTAILAYVEGIRDGRAFFKACRRVSANKPIVLLKGGTSEAGSRACASHTGSMAGAARIFAEACEQAGVILAQDMDDLFFTGAAIVAQPRPRGNRICIITMAGGWGVLAADACAREGLEVVALSKTTLAKYDKFLLDRWSHGNPVDAATTPGRDIMKKCLETAAEAGEVDLIVQTHLGYGGDAVKYFKALKKRKIKHMSFTLEDAKKREQSELKLARFVVGLSRKHQKPILSCSDHMYGDTIEGNIALKYLGKQGIAIHPSPAKAVSIMGKIVRYEKWRAAHS